MELTLIIRFFYIHSLLHFHFNYSRMFPPLRVALSGLDKDAHYCVVLEMAPVSDCRYKFSGSQWVPAGGAEPQSAQRMYIHPDSPALGSHWQAQPVFFNKVKLTNNTLDSQGHVSISFPSISLKIKTQHYDAIEEQRKDIHKSNEATHTYTHPNTIESAQHECIEVEIEIRDSICHF